MAFRGQVSVFCNWIRVCVRVCVSVFLTTAARTALEHMVPVWVARPWGGR